MLTKNAEELKWQGRDDARTLARAEEIKKDKERLSNAQKEAKIILEEKAKELQGLSKVAGKRAPKAVNETKETRNNTFDFNSFPSTPKF